MRVLGRAALLAVVVGALWLLTPWPRPLRLPHPVDRPSVPYELLELARSTPATVLRVGQSARYPLSAQAEPDVKLVVHGQLPQMPADTAGTTWPLALRLEWYDRAGKRLGEWDDHLRVRLVRYRWRDRILTRAFYPYRPEILTHGAAVRLHFDTLKAARELRVTVRSMDPALQGVVLRVYQRETLPEHELSHRWARLSSASQARLVRGSVYGPEYLKERERRAFLRRRWQPVGPGHAPSGARHLLYLLDRNVLRRVEPPVPPPALEITVRRAGVIPVPPGSGKITLKFLSGPSSTAGTIRIQWRPERGAATKEWTISAADASWEETFAETGTLEVRADGVAYLRAFWNGRDITPKPAVARLYRVAAGAVVEYPFPSTSRTRRAIRLTCRRTADAPAAPRTVELHLAFVDAEGRTLHRRALPCDADPDPYVRPTRPGTPAEAFTRAARYYLELPTGIRGLRIQASGEAWVALATRPVGLPYRQRVPDQPPPADTQPVRPRAWFPLLPAEPARLEREGRVLALHRWRRPVEPESPSPDQAQHWGPVSPLRSTRMRHALEPAGPTEATLPAGEAGGYRPVPINQAFEGRLTGIPELPWIRPRLVFTGRDPAPAELEVRVNGRRHWSGVVAARAGRIHLPPLRPGIHRLEIRCARCAGRWFMSDLEGDGPRYLLRTLHRMEGASLEFVHHKTRPVETLTGRLYLPAEAPAEVRLRIQVRPVPRRALQVSPGWTLTERELIIATDPASRIPVLPPSNRNLRAPARFFIPLLEDLPPGTYHIRVQIEAARPPEAYVALTGPTAPDRPTMKSVRVPAPEAHTP